MTTKAEKRYFLLHYLSCIDSRNWYKSLNYSIVFSCLDTGLEKLKMNELMSVLGYGTGFRGSVPDTRSPANFLHHTGLHAISHGRLVPEPTQRVAAGLLH